MGVSPSLHHATSSTFYDYNDQSFAHGSALQKIETIVKQWTDIIHTHKGKERMKTAEYEYLIYEIKKTEKEWSSIIKHIKKTEREWRLLIESNPTLNESIYGPQSNKPREVAMVNEPNTFGEKPLCTMQQKYTKGMEETIKDLSIKLEQEKSWLKQQTERNRLLEEKGIRHRVQLERIQQENKELLLRISKLASDQLLKSNPNIADLSDQNRPTKLGEVFSELYDNEYTEAFGPLCDKGYSERETIDILRETLLNTFDFCSEKATGLLTTTEDAIRHLFHGTGRSQSQDKTATAHRNTLGPKQGSEMASHFRELTDVHVDDMKFALKWKPKDEIKQYEMVKSNEKPNREDVAMKKFEDQMKKLRKEIAVIMVPTIQRAYFRTRWDADCIDQLRPFIEKCIFISWLMNVQSPPMAFLQIPPPGASEQLHGASYRSYTKQGALIDYVVWPAMMLTKNGPIIMKGVAQGL